MPHIHTRIRVQDTFNIKGTAGWSLDLVVLVIGTSQCWRVEIDHSVPSEVSLKGQKQSQLRFQLFSTRARKTQ